jgi:hypothetical protein
MGESVKSPKGIVGPTRQEETVENYGELSGFVGNCQDLSAIARICQELLGHVWIYQEMAKEPQKPENTKSSCYRSPCYLKVVMKKGTNRDWQSINSPAWATSLSGDDQPRQSRWALFVWTPKCGQGGGNYQGATPQRTPHTSKRRNKSSMGTPLHKRAETTAETPYEQAAGDRKEPMTYP